MDLGFSELVVFTEILITSCNHSKARGSACHVLLVGCVVRVVVRTRQVFDVVEHLLCARVVSSLGAQQLSCFGSD